MALIGAPDGVERTLGALPEGVELRRDRRKAPQMAIFFVREARAYVQVLPRVRSVLEGGGAVWIAWPKKTSGVASDLNENRIRDEALARGWVDIKVCAIDATWSGLRLARRRIAR